MVESTEPVLHQAGDNHRGVLSWRFPTARRVISSAPVGDGRGPIAWMLNIGVEADYSRTDLDTHAGTIASSLGLTGSGIALFTAASVAAVCRADCDGVVVHATVGVTKPTWAADPTGGWSDWSPGTINTVVQVPVALGSAAAVNAVATATEAKTQALFEAGVPGTGTASDAVVIAWPADGEPPASEQAVFAGPRSRWGSAIAQAVHRAVLDGIDGRR